MSALFVASHPREVREVIGSFGRKSTPTRCWHCSRTTGRASRPPARPPRATGPRGTGILWASSRGWASTRPLIPSFVDDGAWAAWKNGEALKGETAADRMMPGGFKAFEHQWALPVAFEMHERLGRADIEARTHALASQLKEGLRGMSRVRLVTPTDERLPAGIATVTPYAVRHVRLTPSIVNTPAEADRALAAIRDLA
jgi:selenocysteine lyase/cysteine desulfurase